MTIRCHCLTAVLLATASLTGCDTEMVDDAPGRTTALFMVPRGGQIAGGADFFALPFPSDFWRRGNESGGFELELSLFPVPPSPFRAYMQVIPQRLNGAGRNAATFFRFDGAIDPATLPAEPDAARRDDASVYLVDVDNTSPARGTRWPLKLRFETKANTTIDSNWLSVLPYPGFPLAEGRTYAVVVTKRVHAVDGTPVVADEDWLSLMGPTPNDPDLVRAQDAVEPLMSWLDEPGGDERADVASAAVFTTQRETPLMADLRARVQMLAAPALRDVVTVSSTADYVAFDGAFDSPNFQTGEPPYMLEGGEIVRDAGDHLPVVQRMESLRVAFSVPTGTPPATGWPIAIYAHGTGGSYHSFLDDGTGGRLALQGVATISIDQVLHGPRNPAGNPETTFFNFQNPLSMRDNVIQGAADDFSVVRLIEGIDFVSDMGQNIHFDSDRIYFFGHSQGGFTGPPFVAFEPKVKGAVLSGAGGLIYLQLVTKTQPADLPALIAVLLDEDDLDEFHPMLALMQTWMERGDSANYGPLFAREPASDPSGLAMPPRPIFQTEGLVDSFTPPATIEAFATSIGGDLVGPELQAVAGLELRGRTHLPLPVTGNLNGVTVALAQYTPAPNSDAHFVVFDLPEARTQSASFLGTLAAAGQATVVVP